MAEVYLARHEGPKNFSKVVVLKQVLPRLAKNEKFIQMFLDEGRLAARLSHPNIAQTFELGEHEGRFHIAMEYVPGESLSKVVKKARREGLALPLGTVLRVAVQLLEALDYTHDLKGERGEWLRVVHRDVSPTNVVLTYYGAVKLLDFGIARAASHEHHTQVGAVKGKGGYMAPEQARAQHVDQRADIYAVGALLYLLTTGVGPFDDAGDVFAMMRAAVESRFPRPSERNRNVNPQLEQIILKAMAGRPDDRYPTARLMLADLESCATSQRLFAGAQELAGLMRTLFGERADLAHAAWDQVPDEELMEKVAESFSDRDDDELMGVPTMRARRPRVQPLPTPRPEPFNRAPSGDRAVRSVATAPAVPIASLKGAFDDDDHATEMVISTQFISNKLNLKPNAITLAPTTLGLPPDATGPGATGESTRTTPPRGRPNSLSKPRLMVLVTGGVLLGTALAWVLLH